MHLKKLQLQGFKTFAERTEILFSEGVTAIVGPNGSGKSNLADAILWVLGEQKASALRGATAKDVIFAGSDKRRATGMAEVSLTVDNTDGTLPVEFGEVTITRRAYRTGEGEYFLNKVPCRLKDIYELFLDTGVGREAYSLVNQSEIDAVLSVNPEDRRGLFEEAAGIKKYRVKKREALRKLESTEGNLQRVHDILGEITGRLEPLRYQAQRAEQSLALKARLRSIESTLLIVDLRFADYELTVARESLETDQATVAKHTAQLEAAEELSLEIGDKLAEAESNLETRRQQYQAALSQAERAESQRALAKQRAEGLAASLRQTAQEREELGARRDRLVAQLAELEIQFNEAREAEARLKTDVAARQSVVNGLTSKIAELNRQSERRRAEALSLARQQAGRQADVARAEARVAELEAGLPSLKTELDRLETSVANERALSEEAQRTLDQSREALVQAEKAATDAVAARDMARQAVKDAQSKANASSSDRLAITTRLRTLQDLENAQEGYFAGVKAVFEAKRHGVLSGDFTVVADSFVAPPGYETAFETALAASLQDIITATEDEAKAAIKYLHDSRSGRATFLPLNRMRPSRDTLDLGRAEGMMGVHGAALELLTFDKRFKPALDVLLGRVFVCETLDDALRASNMARGWNRVVTISGELVLPSGALTGGRQSGRGAGQILGRKTEIATLQSDQRKRERDAEQALRALTDAETAREAAERAVSDTQTARQAAQLARSEAERRANYHTTETRRLEEARVQASRRIEAAQAGLGQARETAAKAVSALATGGAETAGSDEAMAFESEQMNELTTENVNLTAELTGVRIALATESERVISLDRSVRVTRNDIEQAGGQEQRKTLTQFEAQAEYDELMARAALRDEESALAAQASVDALAALEEQQRVRQSLAQRANQIHLELRTVAEARSAAMEAIHKTEVREARLDVQRNQLASRLLEEYEITIGEALALENDPEVTDGSPQEVNRLRRELRQLGEVNPAAIDEYAEVSERFEFLTTQRADLDEARAKLLEAIKEIDESTRGVFMETFKAVGVAFDGLFTRLFGGGKTELVLTDPENLLDTGIDILVQPPGKKRQNLALLSGGERALTAAALLFAFLQVKPSPFCVMDEVDAPLDGANVERFADLLREFGQRSQFIIITHNPTTMEAAPIWYGVTMQEPGISRVLSMQVPHIAGEPTPAPNDTQDAKKSVGRRRTSVTTGA